MLPVIVNDESITTREVPWNDHRNPVSKENGGFYLRDLLKKES
jgi:hypothetical protein